jgi:hypothetical protein
MNAFVRISAAIVFVGWASPTNASEKVVGIAHPTCCPKRFLTGCPDDYCRKPMPRFTCLPCGQPDDYCRKPMPRISSLPCGECDDYCRKPRPQTCRPFRPTYYNCGQPAH